MKRISYRLLETLERKQNDKAHQILGPVGMSIDKANPSFYLPLEHIVALSGPIPRWQSMHLNGISSPQTQVHVCRLISFEAQASACGKMAVRLAIVSISFVEVAPLALSCYFFLLAAQRCRLDLLLRYNQLYATN